MVKKILYAILPYAGRYAYDDGARKYKWYDVICYKLYIMFG